MTPGSRGQNEIYIYDDDDDDDDVTCYSMSY
jgi:hypothetical protein